MKLRKICLAALACCITVSLCGCSNPFATDSMQSNPTEPVYSFPRYEIQKLQTEIEAMQTRWKQSGAEETVKKDIQTLLDAENESFAIKMRAQFEHFQKWSDGKKREEFTVTRDDNYVVQEMVTWAFCNGYKYSLYPELFAPYVDESYLTYYVMNQLGRVMSSARMQSSEHGDMLNDYYETANSDSKDVDAMNLKCAQMYLDLLKQYDLSDHMNAIYFRDYTPEQVRAAEKAVRDEIVPIYDALWADLWNDSTYLSLSGLGNKKFDPYAILKEYAPKLSPAIGESCNEMFENKRYYTASGDDSYDVSMTVSLPNEHSALMYTHLNGTYEDLITVTHEFGHYHSDRTDDTPIYLQVNCSDLAEAQSQSMELLFTTYYKDIFGKDAAMMEQIALCNALRGVTTGIGIGLFEYDVMDHIDTYTAKDVVQSYERIYDEFSLDLELYEVTHLYEQPGYCLSYGVSALPAIQIYALMQTDPEKAIATYDKLSSTSSLNGENEFCSVMRSCGLNDPFSGDTVKETVEIIEARIKTIQTQ